MSVTLSEPCDKIAAALVKVSSQVRLVGKGRSNDHDKYTYAELLDYVKATGEALTACGLMLLSSVDNTETLETRKTQSGSSQYAVRVQLTIRAVHESGQWAQVAVSGEGQDRADKGIYKAITGARKYGIACLLGLATSDDPEGDSTVGLDTPPPGQRAVAAAPAAAPAETPKGRFAGLVKGWAQVAPEDTKAAAMQVAKACGFDLTKATDDNFKQASEFIEAHRQNQTFAEWAKENK